MRADDSLLFAFTVLGDPVDLYIVQPPVGASSDPEVLLSKTVGAAFVTGIVGSREIPFRVQETGLHYVLVRVPCGEGCKPTAVQARVYQTFGSLGALPLPLGYATAGLSAIAGLTLLMRRGPWWGQRPPAD